MRTLLPLTGFAAFSLVATVAAAPAAPLSQIATVQGRVIHLSAVSIGLVDGTTGRTVRFLLGPEFDDVFAAGGKPIPIEHIRIGQVVRVSYDVKHMGTRRAERIELLK